VFGGISGKVGGINPKTGGILAEASGINPKIGGNPHCISLQNFETSIRDECPYFFFNMFADGMQRFFERKYRTFRSDL